VRSKRGLSCVFAVFLCGVSSTPFAESSLSPTFNDGSWASVYNHDTYMSNRAVSADIMEPSHAASQVPAKSVKKRLFDTVVEMSEVCVVCLPARHLHTRPRIFLLAHELVTTFQSRIKRPPTSVCPHPCADTSLLHSYTGWFSVANMRGTPGSSVTFEISTDETTNVQ
jgi:hypothetical protein